MILLLQYIAIMSTQVTLSIWFYHVSHVVLEQFFKLTFFTFIFLFYYH